MDHMMERKQYSYACRLDWFLHLGNLVLQAICSTAANEVSAGDDLERDCANVQCAVQRSTASQILAEIKSEVSYLVKH